MKVAVVNNWVPFLSGGAEHLAEALTRKLAEYGHQSMLVRLPFAWHPPGKILEHMLACRCVRLAGVDRVIGLKFPAYYVPHPNKVVWLLHQFRQAYDLWGTRYQDLPDTAEGLAVRDAVVASVPSALVVSGASLAVVSSAAAVVAVSVEPPQPTTTSVEAAMTNTATSPRTGRRRCFIDSISFVSMGQSRTKRGPVHSGRTAAGVPCCVFFDHADDSQPDEVVELKLRQERESGVVGWTEISLVETHLLHLSRGDGPHRLIVGPGPSDQQSQPGYLCLGESASAAIGSRRFGSRRRMAYPAGREEDGGRASHDGQYGCPAIRNR